MFFLSVISRAVPEPEILNRRERMVDFTNWLRCCQYDLANCAHRLGVYPRLGVNFWQSMRPDWVPRETDIVDTLIELFIDGKAVALGRLRAHLPSIFIEDAIEMRLVEVTDGFVASKICLFPCFGKYIVTDQACKNTAINQVMWLWGESFILGGLVKRCPRRRAVDIGTGSGVHAILASNHCERVLCVDINPRALTFARFNCALNGLSNVDFALSDVFGSVEGCFDLLTANPPCVPDEAARPGDNFWTGGPEGTDILRRIVQEIPSRLTPEGTAHLISLYPNPPGTKIRDHFNLWLGGQVNRYDVLDHTWPVPRFEDLISEKPFRGDKSAWRFGVVSLRCSRSGSGFWREVGGKGMFFRSDGSCAVVADHDF